MARRSWLVIGSAALAALALGATAASGDTTDPPVSTYSPTASGVPGVGKTIRTNTGNWSTSATFTYQWLRCVEGSKACTNLPGAPTYTEILGATSATYTIVAADVGHILMARVTATNAAGSTSVLSSGLGPVEGSPPGVKHKPWIRGTKKVGQKIYETGTSWTRSPYMFTDQWLRCSAKGSPCVRIKGSKGRSPVYKLTMKDAGHRMRVSATAWNGAGRTTSVSNPTRIIKQ